jgi:type IV secretory pathway VirJ component
MTDTTPSAPTFLLPGQAAAPPGPVDMTLMYALHHAFRRDLAAFTAAAQRTPASDRATWAALERRWGLFSRSLHEHHSTEDTFIWPALLERADDDGRALLQAMEDEHAEIDPALEACAAGFARLAHHADDAARAALAVRLVATRERLAEHLRHEETDAIALIQRLFTAADWAALEEEQLQGSVPVRQVLEMVAWVLHDLPADVRAHLFAQPKGGAYRAVWLLTRRGFARRERAAFRHVS